MKFNFMKYGFAVALGVIGLEVSISETFEWGDKTDRGHQNWDILSLSLKDAETGSVLSFVAGPLCIAVGFYIPNNKED